MHDSRGADLWLKGERIKAGVEERKKMKQRELKDHRKKKQEE